MSRHTEVISASPGMPGRECKLRAPSWAHQAAGLLFRPALHGSSNLPSPPRRLLPFPMGPGPLEVWEVRRAPETPRLLPSGTRTPSLGPVPLSPSSGVNRQAGYAGRREWCASWEPGPSLPGSAPRKAVHTLSTLWPVGRRLREPRVSPTVTQSGTGLGTSKVTPPLPPTTTLLRATGRRWVAPGTWAGTQSAPSASCRCCHPL